MHVHCTHTYTCTPTTRFLSGFYRGLSPRGPPHSQCNSPANSYAVYHVRSHAYTAHTYGTLHTPLQVEAVRPPLMTKSTHTLHTRIVVYILHILIYVYRHVHIHMQVEAVRPPLMAECPAYQGLKDALALQAAALVRRQQQHVCADDDAVWGDAADRPQHPVAPVAHSTQWPTAPSGPPAGQQLRCLGRCRATVPS